MSCWSAPPGPPSLRGRGHPQIIHGMRPTRIQHRYASEPPMGSVVCTPFHFALEASPYRLQASSVLCVLEYRLDIPLSLGIPKEYSLGPWVWIFHSTSGLQASTFLLSGLPSTLLVRDAQGHHRWAAWPSHRIRGESRLSAHEEVAGICSQTPPYLGKWYKLYCCAGGRGRCCLLESSPIFLVYKLQGQSGDAQVFE